MAMIKQESIEIKVDFIKNSSYQDVVKKIMDTNLHWLTYIDNKNDIKQISEMRKFLFYKIDEMCKDAYDRNNIDALTVAHKLFSKIYDRYFYIEKALTMFSKYLLLFMKFTIGLKNIC
ncbi:MAG: hypothetical protein H0A76_06760 [Candidatus Thiodubiliella endoseptemdiera]|uniref:Uncharacterized protein n=1 Tax=Candidatus Thiodubiliella endoseptemdiera TaxID=2738886 RepID=A0A853F3P3_9GAMM|nr:hypothetical protein [Candidatus Thiodubiliella endoseptemdiera]